MLLQCLERAMQQNWRHRTTDRLGSCERLCGRGRQAGHSGCEKPTTPMHEEPFPTDRLRAQGHDRVFGQMVTFGTRRTESLFNRYGFRVVDRVELTKYRRLYRGQVLLCTVLKDLRASWTSANSGSDTI